MDTCNARPRLLTDHCLMSHVSSLLEQRLKIHQVKPSYINFHFTSLGYASLQIL